MSDRVRCKINTEVFDTVDSLMRNFNNSILEIQKHINQYLDDASEDFERQLKAIDYRLFEAEEEEKRSKEMEEKAKTAWEDATEARENAEYAFQHAREGIDLAFEEKEAAKRAWLKAKETQQDAYYAKKDHDIGHDEFEGYKEDTDVKHDEFLGWKEDFEEKRILLNSKKSELQDAQYQEKSAKNSFFEAKKRHKEAIRECEIREANLKEAERLVQTFKSYKDDYYHPYCNLGQNPGCDSLLLVMTTNMRQEFGLAMKQIHEAVDNILRCSLKEGMTYDDSYYVSTNRSQKSDEMRYRIKERLRENQVKLNRELDRPEDERPNYAECCKVCGRLIGHCNCSKKNEPLSMTE